MSEKKEKTSSKSNSSEKNSKKKTEESKIISIKEETGTTSKSSKDSPEKTPVEVISKKEIKKVEKPSPEVIKKPPVKIKKVAESDVEKKEKPSTKSKKTTIKEETPKKNSTKDIVEDEAQDKEETVADIPPVVDAPIENSVKDEALSKAIVKEEKNYKILTEEQLIKELQTIIINRPIQEIKVEVEEIKTEFNDKFNKELEKNKEEFLAEGKNIIDFYYTTPLKKEFDTAYYEYRDKRNKYYKNLTKDLKENFNNRLEIIEELKELFNKKENTSTIFKQFKDIQERWYEAGAIPRDKYNTVWNNYHHHVENFYDILHLDRSFRDRNFKNNLEQKLRLVGRAEELAKEENSNKAFRELQMLHKIWKEEIGPVAKEIQEEVWDKFSSATKIIHDKRHLHIEELEKKFEANVVIKKKLIEDINQLTINNKQSHQGWQNNIKKVQEIRDQFFETGRVPKANNKEIWNLFKDATSSFNKEKNIFYKNQKKDQFDNLEKKRELITIANENKDGDDFEVITPLMKKIQNDWKNIGHVPRKDSDKIWKEFKSICNYYFDRLHSKEDEDNKEDLEHLASKKELLNSLDKLKLKGDSKEDLITIKEKIKAWKEIGQVPYNKRKIEFSFNKKLDELFNLLDLGKKETELIKFENKINSLNSQEDDRKLRNEEFFISKKVGESKDEIRQLENNLLFFKHVKDTNPMVVDVNKKINGQKEQLEVWKAKLKKIRALR